MYIPPLYENQKIGNKRRGMSSGIFPPAHCLPRWISGCFEHVLHSMEMLRTSCTVYCNKIRFNEWYFIYIKSQFLHHPSSFQTNKQKIDYTIKLTTLTSLLNSIVYPIQYSLQYSSIVKSVFFSYGQFVQYVGVS